MAGLFFSGFLHATPDWFGVHSEDDAKIYGYGQGATLQQAKTQAYSDLANIVEVRIINQTTSKKVYRQGQLDTSVISGQSSHSDVVFRNNVVVANSTLSDGVYYVALLYNKAGFYQRLYDWLSKSGCQNSPQSYWYHVSFLQSWLRDKKCLPEIHIERFAGGWQLTSHAGSLVLPDAQYDSLFYTHGSGSIQLHSTKSRLKPGDYYFISLYVKQAGYLSLFQVYKNGSTGVLLSNQPVQAGEVIHYPDARDYEGIEALLELEGESTFDANIALLCDEKIDTSIFEMLDESPLSDDESGFNLILDKSQHCLYRMERLTIRNPGVIPTGQAYRLRSHSMHGKHDD
ncbi:hypothetical protein VQ7734_00924 [Vibrio quintilis]|uniref:DUF4384 domain-containing protein n=1 Tax=Vibrio quintilis TaxID=1117707 RepID=A0A1M7YRL6_9VIBR|nr:hypothetical protein [Vibrio quintilis]SHO55205.1 hypothetical protein VQ7734_00924 [Vibrio quintilis]